MKACLTNELPFVQRIMNLLTVESLGVLPSSILFVNAIDLDRGIFFPHMTKANAQIKLSRHAG